jgi:purine-binding chemotaxis protein CheW
VDYTRPFEEEFGMGQELKVIVFKLGSEEYGIDVDKVETIERMLPITRVPKTFAFVKGVVNLRGVVIPVIDLRGRFGLPESEPTDQTRIIIVSVEEMQVGFIVDSANDVIDLDTDVIDTPPEVVGGVKAKYLDGVARITEERLLIMLNLSEVLNKSEIIQLEGIEA